MAAVTRVTITIRDRYLQESRLVVHFPGALSSPLAGPISGFISVLAAMILGVVVRVEISIVESVGGSAGTGAYATVEDKGMLILVDENGTAHRYSVPGPVGTIIESSDHETILNTGAVATWTSAMLAGAVGSGGDALISYTRGFRTISRKLNKK